MSKHLEGRNIARSLADRFLIMGYVALSAVPAQEAPHSATQKMMERKTNQGNGGAPILAKQPQL